MGFCRLRRSELLHRAARCLVVTLLLSLLTATPARASQDGPQLPEQVRAIFQAKCAGCHGPELARPKGRFGYVLDLPRMAANPDLIVAEAPDQSELFLLIETREMPPRVSRTGPLTQAEIDLVRQWIALGAEAPSTPPPAQPSPSTSSGTEPLRGGNRIIDWLGRFHPVTVHFPIALLLFAAVGLVADRLAGTRRFDEMIRWCLLAGAAAAVVTAGLGWLRAPYAGYTTELATTLEQHRWLGVATAAVAVLAAWLSERSRRPDPARWVAAWRVLLIVAACLVALAGHWGGALIYGPDYYRW